MNALRIAIVGGGPGGLFLATLLKYHDPDRHVAVYEQNPEGATYGFGVGFTDLTLDHFEAAAPGVEQEIRDNSITWDTIEVHHNDEVFEVEGNPYSAISRAVLLEILTRRAEVVGVDFHFQHRIEDVSALAESNNVIVGADGVNSAVRALAPEAFGAEVRSSALRYIWFGADAPADELFTALTFGFAQSEHGAYGIHAYPYGCGPDDSKTAFIVETDVDTWRAAGLDRPEDPPLAPGENDLVSKTLCEELFVEELGGWDLVGNNSKWNDFANVSCRQWHSGPYVLLGDAAHTAHFSLGSGTKMAMEDAISLARALESVEANDLTQAFETYQTERQSPVTRLQRASEPSRMWWENFSHVLDLDPHEFLFNFMTRTGLMTYDRLRRRDSRFVRAVLAAKADDPSLRRDRSSRPVQLPLLGGRLDLTNRLVGDARVRNGETATEAATLARAYLACGAGSVLVGPVTTAADLSSATQLVSGMAHAAKPRRLLIELGPPVTRDVDNQVLENLRALVRSASLGGALAVLVRLLIDQGPDLADEDRTTWIRRALRDVGAHRTPDAVLGVALRLPWSSGQPTTLDEVERLVSAIAEEGVGLALVEANPGSPPLAHVSRQEGLALVADAVRNRSGLTTVLAGLTTEDAANTAVLGGRADLVAGRPRLAGLGWIDAGVVR